MNAPPAKKARGPEAPATAEPAHKIDFERSLARLEEVVRRLENAKLPLDEAMKLFEEGVELAKKCQQQLEEAESRVEVLLKAADGKLAAVPFPADGSEAASEPEAPEKDDQS